MQNFKIPAALLVISAMSLGAPAVAAPVTALSAAAKPMAQRSEQIPVRFGGWHGGWHGGAGFAAGALAGALIGGAIAAPYYGGGYYPSYGYGYSDPAYTYDSGWAPEAYPSYGTYHWNPHYRWGG
ncbi:hypothetical protein [Bradyrhizobium sp.]|uniref:hypothetical protein n=1 Tax=Bradyrhizobium sp. TaxID=376 RepID=UPI001DD06F8D|nr:hypothetical protein [Bradyrhizobium sp.]MBV8696430.1 hypothetical protein [Bradyrhizobium sp.]MBV8919238.1 hypothetical protein [Bradyrhizobium sp.]MBV9978928.1 hypothetical protein [Bradyrhizobium sp.]